MRSGRRDPSPRTRRTCARRRSAKQLSVKQTRETRTAGAAVLSASLGHRSAGMYHHGGRGFPGCCRGHAGSRSPGWARVENAGRRVVAGAGAGPRQGSGRCGAGLRIARGGARAHWAPCCGRAWAGLEIPLPAACAPDAAMIIPVRCFTCGKIVGNKWEAYLGLLQAEYTEG